jgi:hypothetical protein
MDLVADVEEVKGGQLRSRIADRIIGRVHCFNAKIIACATHERGVTEARDFGHFAQPHIGAHCDDTGEELPWIGLVFDVPVEHMRESLEKAGANGNEPEQPRDVDAGDLAVEGVIDVLIGLRIAQVQARLAALVPNPEVGIVASVDVMVDMFEEALDVIMQTGKRLRDGREQDLQVELVENGVLVPPARVTDQIVFETAKLVAVVTEDVACLKCVAQQPVDEKLEAIHIEPLRLAGSGVIEMGLECLRDERRGEGRWIALSKWRAAAQALLQKVDGFEQRRIFDAAGPRPVRQTDAADCV